MVSTWLTPILITISIFILGMILTSLRQLEQRIFQHLTNAELHMPKADVISALDEVKERLSEMNRIVARLPRRKADEFDE